MEKFIPFEKLSKKRRRELMTQRRKTWGVLSPVTRRPENPKAYNRKKTRKWSEDSITVSSVFVGVTLRVPKSPAASAIEARHSSRNPTNSRLNSSRRS